MTDGMDGRVCLVTGATSGIGLETAVGLARMGATVVVHGRTTERAESAANNVRRRAGGVMVEAVAADLSALDAVRGLADEVRSRFAGLRVLVNNAGVVSVRRQLTADGYELTFAVNHLAPFLLTNLLLDTLASSNTDNGKARVVTVASEAHRAATIDFANLQGERSYGGLNAYNTSKLCNILFTLELARRLDDRGITANCLHPGVILSTGLWDVGWFLRIPTMALAPLFRGARRGAETSIYLASSPELAETSGAYFSDSRLARASDAAFDAESARRLWELSEQLTGYSRQQ
jgi:retinol dehydrogenase 12